MCCGASTRDPVSGRLSESVQCGKCAVEMHLECALSAAGGETDLAVLARRGARGEWYCDMCSSDDDRDADSSPLYDMSAFEKLRVGHFHFAERCGVCDAPTTGGGDDEIIECDGCEHEFHRRCLDPSIMPKDDDDEFFCQACHRRGYCYCDARPCPLGGAAEGEGGAAGGDGAPADDEYVGRPIEVWYHSDDRWYVRETKRVSTVLNFRAAASFAGFWSRSLSLWAPRAG